MSRRRPAGCSSDLGAVLEGAARSGATRRRPPRSGRHRGQASKANASKTNEQTKAAFEPRRIAAKRPRSRRRAGRPAPGGAPAGRETRTTGGAPAGRETRTTGGAGGPGDPGTTEEPPAGRGDPHYGRSAGGPGRAKEACAPSTPRAGDPRADSARREESRPMRGESGGLQGWLDPNRRSEPTCPPQPVWYVAASARRLGGNRTFVRSATYNCTTP